MMVFMTLSLNLNCSSTESMGFETSSEEVPLPPSDRLCSNQHHKKTSHFFLESIYINDPNHLPQTTSNSNLLPFIGWCALELLGIALLIQVNFTILKVWFVPKHSVDLSLAAPSTLSGISGYSISIISDCHSFQLSAPKSFTDTSG
jgi:hypothetical protein